MADQPVFVDQLEADQRAIEFLSALGRQALHSTPHVEIQWHNHELSGRTGSLWVRNKVVAITVVLRNDLNRSVLIRQQLAPI